MKGYFKKNIIVFLYIFVLLSLSSCKKNQQIIIPEESTFQVIFFDIENSSDGSIHYDGVNNDRTLGYDSVKPADCYMIKSGNFEILVDGGFQLQAGASESYNNRVAKVYQENVIKKIEKYCTDNVLEYLIVTHGDYDHLIGLAVDNGILDYFSSDKRIDKIIDFDSEMVAYLSNPDGNELLSSNNNFYTSPEIINKYREKRDKLVSDNKTIHIPASEFFNNDELLKENTLLNAMPDKRKYQYFRLDKNGNLTDQVNTALVTNFYYFSNGIIYHNECDPITKNQVEANYRYVPKYKKQNLDFGTLKEENGRYYFSIILNTNVELRILYNWNYDHFYRHSFDSQDRNNISVCFEVLSGNNKFLSLGDMGFGESGIINYYKDTSILKNVNCFKASHHGSTNNSENSSALYNLMKADVVIVPGVAQNTNVGNGTAVMKNDFFNNVLSANSNTKIYCTQISQVLDNVNGLHFISAPFYGDIIVIFYQTGLDVDCTYKGQVDGFISMESNDLKHVIFNNYSENHMISYNETDFWKLIYLNK